MSLNHQYERGRGTQFCKPNTPGAFQTKRGRWVKKSQFMNQRLRPEVLHWRESVALAMGSLKESWRPSGITAAIILIESPYWLTARRTVRQQDLDNKLKPLIDAIQHATNVVDELHWQLHAFKVLSKRQRTTIFLYDLGDVVEYYY